MSEGSTTPGPWRPPTDKDDDDVVILLPLVGPHGCDEDPCPHPEGRGDVVLAAAAPAMYAALDRIEERLSAERRDEPDGFPDRCERALDIARAALASGKGEVTVDE